MDAVGGVPSSRHRCHTERGAREREIERKGGDGETESNRESKSLRVLVRSVFFHSPRKLSFDQVLISGLIPLVGVLKCSDANAILMKSADRSGWAGRFKVLFCFLDASKLQVGSDGGNAWVSDSGILVSAVLFYFIFLGKKRHTRVGIPCKAACFRYVSTHRT